MIHFTFLNNERKWEKILEDIKGFKDFENFNCITRDCFHIGILSTPLKI